MTRELVTDGTGSSTLPAEHDKWMIKSEDYSKWRFHKPANKRVKLSLDPNPQGDDYKSSDKQRVPLGLKLTITPSLINEVNAILLQPKIKCNTTSVSTRFSDVAKPNIPAYRSQQRSEKLKASNINALSLIIGTYERSSVYEGDLVTKCYYAKKKLVWEVLEGAMKRKIEISWGDIDAIAANIQENKPGILEVELNQRPQFFKETDPQPRKHTLWHAASDFTGGQALICRLGLYKPPLRLMGHGFVRWKQPLWKQGQVAYIRPSETPQCGSLGTRRHRLEFPPGVLNKLYEKLLQCDERLLELSRKPFPNTNCPYFHTKSCTCNCMISSNLAASCKPQLFPIPHPYSNLNHTPNLPLQGSYAGHEDEDWRTYIYDNHGEIDDSIYFVQDHIKGHHLPATNDPLFVEHNTNISQYLPGDNNFSQVTPINSYIDSSKSNMAVNQWEYMQDNFDNDSVLFFKGENLDPDDGMNWLVPIDSVPSQFFGEDVNNYPHAFSDPTVGGYGGSSRVNTSYSCQLWG